MKTIKELYQSAKSKFSVVAVTVVTAVGTTSAQAAYTLPTAVETAFTDIMSAFTAIEAKIWVPLAAVAVAWFVIRMFKKGTSKVG